ncbi:hypothetical protein NDU88_007507 [Pleurodeles waltl]|uniref:Uncharacterized protein n=1 Tax=Pleurodeles waltl TaxID=8319 RepID=A0AAV7QP19_PLEWA|nr:hypothetical protein NDU88_007507 [Pleurodeles waltl]
MKVFTCRRSRPRQRQGRCCPEPITGTERKGRAGPGARKRAGDAILRGGRLCEGCCGRHGERAAPEARAGGRARCSLCSLQITPECPLEAAGWARGEVVGMRSGIYQT